MWFVLKALLIFSHRIQWLELEDKIWSNSITGENLPQSDKRQKPRGDEDSCMECTAEGTLAGKRWQGIGGSESGTGTYPGKLQKNLAGILKKCWKVIIIMYVNISKDYLCVWIWKMLENITVYELIANLKKTNIVYQVVVSGLGLIYSPSHLWDA